MMNNPIFCPYCSTHIDIADDVLDLKSFEADCPKCGEKMLVKYWYSNSKGPVFIAEGFSEVIERVKKEKKYRRGNVGAIIMLALVAIVVIAFLLLLVKGCSSNTYQPSTEEVWEWFDQKDDSGNYINRGDYNGKRSY